MASLGATVLDRMTSEISRFRAISSKLLLVAFSICSSKAVLAEDDHQLIMVGDGDVRSVGVAGEAAGNRQKNGGMRRRKIKGARVLTVRVAWLSRDGDDDGCFSVVRTRQAGRVTLKAAGAHSSATQAAAKAKLPVSFSGCHVLVRPHPAT